MSDSFLDSMTFARAGEFLDKCDCEECENIPPSIRAAIDLKKLERRAAGPIKRTQQRSLISRDGQISVWCMNMPKNAEPLVEFGSSHRIVWVKQLGATTTSPGTGESTSTLRWIGKGIIGSNDEEKSRKTISEWTEGNFFLVPSNGGKAIGWIHTDSHNLASTTSAATTTKDDGVKESIPAADEKKSENYGVAVLCVAKIPLHLVDKGKGRSEDSTYKNWSNQLIKYCRNGLDSYENQPENDPSYYKFPDEASKLLKMAFREAEGLESKADDETEPANKKLRLDQTFI